MPIPEDPESFKPLDLSALHSLSPNYDRSRDQTVYRPARSNPHLVTAAKCWAFATALSIFARLTAAGVLLRDNVSWFELIHKAVANLSYLPILVLLLSGLLVSFAASRPSAGQRRRYLGIVLAGVYMAQALSNLQLLGGLTQTAIWLYISEAVSLALITSALVASVNSLPD
ncbi:Uncharacterised protein [Actinomyces bovis]|uniref:Uncharacterized protein n=1 Tax=Actinomyces bovis TaxID=1658 RepID=A0ABY1VN92_9ACTO|nr:hypothetical protein [Actinomyces bovis]SPT53530.1 Uncharacterised protein [Actinomyces bovis]VEG55481.1 Uncharacterised protein [Actinomyces israelii]